MPSLTTITSTPQKSSTTTSPVSRINKKPNNMDKLFSISGSEAANAAAVAAASAAAAASHNDDNNPYIMPSFADNFDSWAYPETQQAVFEDWVANTSPPMSAPAGYSPATLSPTLTPPSAATSIDSSPSMVNNDIALSLASTIQSDASATVAAYAAALFPDMAASLSSSVVSPAESNVSLPTSPQNVALPTFANGSNAAQQQLDWAELAGLLETAATADIVAEPAVIKKESVAASPDPGTDEQRKRRDNEFLASLPPQLALKRRRTSNLKQKEKILAEIMNNDAPPVAAISEQPAPKRRAVSKTAAATKKAVVDASAAESKEEDASAENKEEDAAALKRKKNTDAARRSRMRKVLRIETLESRVSELEAENARLAQMVAALEAEKASC